MSQEWLKQLAELSNDKDLRKRAEQLQKQQRQRVTHPHPHPLPLRGRGSSIVPLLRRCPLSREAGEG